MATDDKNLTIVFHPSKPLRLELLTKSLRNLQICIIDKDGKPMTIDQPEAIVIGTSDPTEFEGLFYEINKSSSAIVEKVKEGKVSSSFVEVHPMSGNQRFVNR